VAVPTVVWLAVTFLTRPESEQTLLAFYRRTRPSGGLGTSRRPRPRRAPVGRRPRQPGRLGRRLRTGVRGAVRLGKTAAARDAARRGTARGRRHRGRDRLSRLVATRLADGGGIAARGTGPGESGRRPRGRRRGPAPGGSPCSSAWG